MVVVEKLTMRNTSISLEYCVRNQRGIKKTPKSILLTAYNFYKYTPHHQTKSSRASPPRKKTYFLQTWSSEILVISSDIEVYHSLLGPTSANIIPLTERSLVPLKFSQDLTKSVLGMEFNAGVYHKLFGINRSFGSHNIRENNSVNPQNILIVSLAYDIFLGWVLY